MSSTVIRDFFVSLGFTTDNEGAKKMGDTLSSVTNKAGLLSKALIALATGAVVAVAKTASGLDKLYYSSQRIGASAENIRAYGDAISQMGGDAQSALQSLESVAQKMRNSPGYEGMLSSLGVATRDSNGAMRDRVEVMKDLSKTFASMPSYQANAYANSLGIDEKTMLAMRDGKFLDNMQKYQKIRTQVGLNDDLAKSGSEFMTEFHDTAMMTKAITEVVIMTAGKALIPLLKMINKFLQSAISWFNELNPNIKALIAAGLKIALVTLVFGSFIAAIAKIASILPLMRGLLFLIRGISLAFLASPIGIVLALGAAIALLYDDYKTWAEGGESLFDWGGFIDHLNSAKEYALKLGQQFLDLTSDYVHWSKLAEDGSSWLKLKGFIDENGVSLKSLRNGFMNLHKDIINYALPTLKGYGSILSKVFSGDFKGALKEASEMAKNLSDRMEEGAKNTWEFIKDVKNGDNAYFDASRIDLSGVTNTAKKVVKAVTSSVIGDNKGNYAFSFGKDVDSYITEAAKKYGIDEKILRGFVKMEAGWTGKMSPTGAIGTGQFIKSTWDDLAKTEEGKAIGMTKIGNRFRKNNDPRYDKKVNTLATGLLAKQNAEVLKKYGIAVTGENLYLAHNIGAVTFAKAFTGKGANAGGLKAMRQNGMQKNETPKEFVDRQRSIYMQHYNQANKISSGDLKAFSINSQSSQNINSSALKNAPLLPANYSASNSKQNSVVVNQNYTSEMHINGADNPQMIASEVNRTNENAMIRMAHNAKGVMG